ncbi:MAG: adenylate/guanylate cyclase domain-containing protein [Chitinophagaceae bacterium]
MSASRQLAAIMFTDIVGYTALMGKDEQKAFELLHKNRDIHKPLIKQYHGTWIKELGDGVLASFHTVTDAVFCAAAIHQACSKVDGLQLRMGIHLGEVIFEDHDVFGDGVNIASRLQAMASPGSTWVSEAVYKNLVNKKEITSEFIKEETLKNVSEPVKVYEITVKEIPGYLPDNIKAYQKKIISAIVLLVGLAAAYFLFFNKQPKPSPDSKAGTEKSIAVLPFTDMSQDKDQEYFSDGLSEELINALAKIPDLKVAGRTSSFSYKGKNKDLKAIGDELKVSTILEGSLRKSGNQLRITAQLINADDGFHIWSDTYETELTDIFGVQDKITKAIITALNVHLLNNKEPEATTSTSPDAYSKYLQARQQLSFRGEHLLEARRLFEETIKLDPDFAPAHSGLARTLTIIQNYLGAYNVKSLMDSAKLEANKALSLNSNNGEAWSVLGTVAAYYDWDWSAAEKAFTRSMAISPNDAEIYNFIGDFYWIVYNKKLAIEMESRALELDPLLAVNYANLAVAYFMAKDYDNAIRISNTSLSMNLQGFTAVGNWTPLVWAYLKTKQFDKAEDIVNQIPESDPLHLELTTDIAIAKGENALALANLQKMKDQNHDPSRLAESYLQLKMWEKAAQEIEKAYAGREVRLVYFTKISLPEDYADHPALKKAFDKPELKKLFELRRKNIGSQKN